MECSICMEHIEEDANISKTSCGHPFHFECLYRWHRTNTTCPLCRKDFGGRQEEAFDYFTGIPPFVIPAQPGTGRSSMIDLVFPPLDLSFRRNLVNEVTRINEQVPIEEYTGEIEERDIQLIMRQVPDVSRQTAEAYLRYYGGDLVETILYLNDHKDMPIPRFRRRDRPNPTEPYVSPLIFDRIYEHHHENSRSGYESA